MTHPLRALWPLALLLVVPSILAADEGATAASRSAFAAAYAEAEAGAGPPPGGDPAALVNYPLYPYLEAARLRSALAQVPAAGRTRQIDQRIGAFLEQHGKEPVGRTLRRPWLASLAARHEWRDFLAAFSRSRSPDQALRCQALRARIALGQTDGLASAAIAEWLTPRSADDACNPVFDWLRSSDAFDAALIERRARLALAEGETQLARWLARSLPDERARPLREWALLLDNPRAAIDALIRSPATPVEEAALLDGWSRLARRDPDAARDRIDALIAARGLDDAGQSQFARALALGLAWSRHEGSLKFFRRVAATDLTPADNEWRARAALWAGDWQSAAEAIAAMPDNLRQDPRWRYWAARAAAAGGDDARARELYAAVVPADNWYAVLAAARLGQSFEPHQQGIIFDAASVAAVAGTPALVRARELLLLGWLPQAQAEWNSAWEDMDAGTRQAAIGVAAGWGWHFQVIAAAAQRSLFNDYRLLYPTPFDDEVETGARVSGLHANLLYAVMRQESLYQPQAVSAAGAIGLMQLMPHTANLTARAMKRARPSRSALMRPEINIPLGAGHLAALLQRFDGQLLLALAAYNAGPNAVRRWLPEAPMDVDIWVENIPYNETRAYVQRVMWHSVVFKWLHDGKPEGAANWLVQVKPLP